MAVEAMASEGEDPAATRSNRNPLDNIPGHAPPHASVNLRGPRVRVPGEVLNVFVGNQRLRVQRHNWVGREDHVRLQIVLHIRIGNSHVPLWQWPQGYISGVDVDMVAPLQRLIPQCPKTRSD